MHNILVIDDDAEVRDVVVKTLRHFGFGTRDAEDGRAGIELALAETPDLIICDIRMPKLDGFKTLSAIRDLPEVANVPFIFLTANIDKDSMRRGMTSGADDYLTKPFTQEELLEAVTSRLARQTELECEYLKRADQFRRNADHLLARELSQPLDGILSLTADLLRANEHLAPEKITANARRIGESVLRLSELAQSLA